MYDATTHRQPAGSNTYRHDTTLRSRPDIRLTRSDRLRIEALLRDGVLRHSPAPALLEGLLRHKLRFSCEAEDPAPADRVTTERRVTFMISGGGARTGILCLRELCDSATDTPCLQVASLLGATLLGMRVQQKSPLLQEDGQIATVVVLAVGPSAKPAPTQTVPA
tara:strand:- start:1921 stop:2415 length:495 start_codon:yes stop_codon:yes gene_type:complete